MSYYYAFGSRPRCRFPHLSRNLGNYRKPNSESISRKFYKPLYFIYIFFKITHSAEYSKMLPCYLEIFFVLCAPSDPTIFLLCWKQSFETISSLRLELLRWVLPRNNVAPLFHVVDIVTLLVNNPCASSWHYPIFQDFQINIFSNFCTYFN